MARADLAAALLGVACVAGGGVLWSMALRSQRESIAAEPGARPAVAAAAPVVAASAAPSAAPCPTVAAAASAGVGPAPAVSVQMTGGSLGLRFVRGDALLLKEDRARAAEVAARLVQNDHVKVSLEGFADDPGPDKRALAKKRAAVMRALLVERGVDLERISVAIGDLNRAPEGAGQVRLHTNPPLPEGETKAP
ncbi:MAG TPA: OmpA family protein [Polyangiaceae bacterium]|nr:OmpA family protein [Polyangiaceae bacterium]